MNPRDDATRDQPKEPESTAPDGGIVTLYAQRLAAFRQRAPIRKHGPPRVIPFGRGAASSQSPQDQDQAPPE